MVVESLPFFLNSNVFLVEFFPEKSKLETLLTFHPEKHKKDSGLTRVLFKFYF